MSSKKKILITIFSSLLVIILVIIIIFICQKKEGELPEEKTTNWKTYRNEEFGFEFQYPENWIFRNNTSYSPFSKFDLIGAPSEKEHLIYYPVPPFLINIVTSDFVERQFFDLKNITSKTIVGGVEGLKYEYEEQKLSHITVILPLGEYEMILGATEEYKDTFDQIIATFRFIEE